MKNKIEDIISKIKKSDITLGSCESITGGLFSATIASYPGVSSFFKGAICSYSTLVKKQLLKIDEEIINKYGVVSKEVATEMALKSQLLLDVDLAISFTGNAGPTAMENKDVGLVYIGIYYKGIVETKELHLEGSRNQIREKSVEEGFNFIEQVLDKYN